MTLSLTLCLILAQLSQIDGQQNKNRLNFNNQSSSLNSELFSNHKEEIDNINEANLQNENSLNKATPPLQPFHQDGSKFKSSIVIHKRSLQTTTTCPAMSFAESYTTTFGLNTFYIQPTMTLTCNNTGYSARSLSWTENGVPSLGLSPSMVEWANVFNYNVGLNQIKITNWTQLQNNTYYNLTLTMNVGQLYNSLSNAVIKDNFVLIIGSVNLLMVPLGDKVYKYQNKILIDYASTLDPSQPETGKLTSFYSCDPYFAGCSNLKLTSNILDPLTLIQTNRLVFNRQYNFNVTLTNLNTKQLKSINDRFSFLVRAPEDTDPQLSCINFTLTFKNKTLPFSAQNQTYREILFDNNNYTEVALTTPLVNISSCQSIYGQNIATIAFTTFDNAALFDDVGSYQFNSTPVTISSAKIQQALSTTMNQSINSYVYLYTTDMRIVLGYQMVKLTLREGDQTLYAKIAQSFIQVDRDRILYIDGGSSYDLKATNSNFTFIWKIEGFPSVVLPNQRLLQLSPDQRNALGINQMGRYYNYTLTVMVDDRMSYPTKVLVQVSPGLDPQKCVTVQLKDIDIMSIITYTNLPLMLQARVIKGNCTDMIMGALVWSCTDVSWRFWANFGNNNTVWMEADDLKKLPKSREIRMNVTQYYRVQQVEYMAILNFQLFVERADLVPVITYPQVFNPRENSNLILDSNSSYDPQAVAMETTDIPIKCIWECPSSFSEACSVTKAVTTNNGCTLTIPSTGILQSSNYNFQITGQMWLFKNTITKDKRQTISYVYVSILDSARYPMCNITYQRPYQNSINTYQYLNTSCKPTLISNPSKFTYLWSLYSWDTMVYVPELQYMVTDQPVLRIPPYLLSPYKEILVQLMVTADVVYSTPIGLYLKLNDQSNFVKGTISVNFNSFTAYLSNFVMTPGGWDSGLSSQLFFQYRIKESLSTFRVLLSPQEANSLLPITTQLPPLIYENFIYIDIIDTLGNYFTIKQGLVSKPDILMTATQFAIRVNNITQTILYSFNEVIFEQSIFRLKLAFQAYQMDQINTENQPESFFRILSEATIQYLYNTFVIDKRQNQVLFFERRSQLSQHIIETLYSITYKLRNTLQPSAINQTVQLLNTIVSSGNYTLGSQFSDISSKIFIIAYSLQDGNNNLLIGTQNAFDVILIKLLQDLQKFLYQGESLTFTQGGYDFTVKELSGSVQNLLDLPNFQYDKNEVYGVVNAPVGGMMILAKNDSFAHVQMYDKNFIQLGVSKLSKAVNMTFKMNSDITQRYSLGLITPQCQSRDTFSQSWTSTRITMSTINNVTGEIICLATHFTQYRLIWIDKAPAPPPPPPPPSSTPALDPTKITQTNQTIPEVVGTWNSSIPNSEYTIGGPEMIFLFDEKPMLMYMISLGCLVFFIMTHCMIKTVYKAEHNDQPKVDMKYNFTYQYTQSRCKNRCRLYRLILINFNPYLNLFKVYNKFLPRWVRNQFIQIFFMTFSLAFGINETLISYEYSLFNTDELLLATFFIVLFGILLIRPVAIKLAYSLLYEPNSRVEDYQDTSSSPDNMIKNNINNHQIDLIDNQFLPQVIDYEIDMKEANQEHISVVNNNSRKSQNFSMSMRRENEKDDSKKHQMNSGVLLRESQREESIRQSVRRSMEKINEYSQNGFQPQNEIQKEQSFLPSIFKPNPISAGAGFQISPSPDTMPSFGGHQLKDKRSIFNAFDEIDLEKDHVPKLEDDSEVVMNNQKEEDGAPDNMFQFGQTRQYQNLNIAHVDDEKPKKGKGKGKKKLVKQNQNNKFAEIQTNGDHTNNEVKSSQSFLPEIKGAFRQSIKQPVDTLRDSQSRRSNAGPVGFLKFYNQEGPDQNSLNPDGEDDDLNPQFEGGDQNEEEKEPQSIQKRGVFGLQEGNLERLESVEEENRPRYQSQSLNSPNTDINSIQNGGNYPSSSEGRLIDDNLMSQKLKGSMDPVAEHTLNLTNNTSDVMLQQTISDNKRYFISKHFGKTLVLILWGGLMVANLMCFSRMVYKQFIDWIILSCVGFFSLVFIIDPILYFILACFMLKDPSRDEMTGLKSEGVHTPENNYGGSQDHHVEYFTKKYCRDKQRSKIADFYVFMLIGKEKMKDLRRKLNPMNPI